MKRLQISIEVEMDKELGVLARAAGQSKAALIRRMVRKELRASGAPGDDPLMAMAGHDDFEPGSVDEVTYR